MSATAVEAPPTGVPVASAGTTAEVIVGAHMLARRIILDLLARTREDSTSQGAVLHALRELDREFLDAALQVTRDLNAALVSS